MCCRAPHATSFSQYIAGELWTWVVVAHQSWTAFFRDMGGSRSCSPERDWGLFWMKSYLPPSPSFPEFSHCVSDPVLYCSHAWLETQLCRKLYLSKSTHPNFAFLLCFWISLLGKSRSSLLCFANCCARENCCLESELSVLKTQFELMPLHLPSLEMRCFLLYAICHIGFLLLHVVQCCSSIRYWHPSACFRQVCPPSCY